MLYNIIVIDNNNFTLRFGISKHNTLNDFVNILDYIYETTGDIKELYIGCKRDVDIFDCIPNYIRKLYIQPNNYIRLESFKKIFDNLPPTLELLVYMKSKQCFIGQFDTFTSYNDTDDCNFKNRYIDYYEELKSNIRVPFGCEFEIYNLDKHFCNTKYYYPYKINMNFNDRVNKIRQYEKIFPHISFRLL